MLNLKKPFKLCSDSDENQNDKSTETIEEEEESADFSTTHDSEILRMRSRGTLNSEFFDNLWPMILKENICEVKSRDHKIFYPVQKFDVVWGHTLLAEKGYKDYCQPVELRCFKETIPEDKVHKRVKDKCVKLPEPKILTVTEQIQNYQREVELGQYLSNRFIQRKRPWYVKQTIYDDDFEITEEMLAGLTTDFDKQIAAAIKEYNIKLLAIDMGTDIQLSEMEHWVPFCKFVNIIVAAHDPDIARKLRILGDIFIVLDFTEDVEAYWQEDLERSLNQIYECAIEKDLLNNIVSEFVFAFSQSRGLCKITSFEVISKSFDENEVVIMDDQGSEEQTPCYCN